MTYWGSVPMHLASTSPTDAPEAQKCQAVTASLAVAYSPDASSLEKATQCRVALPLKPGGILEKLAHSVGGLPVEKDEAVSQEV